MDRYRFGFEAALELCLAELQQAESKEDALRRITEFQILVKEDKLGRIREMVRNIRR